MSFWLKETHTDGYYVGWKVNEVLCEEKTEYQNLMIVETQEFGRALVLDGAVQTTERDEFIYHEMISQVAMHAHPNPRRVLVVGGGDGGAVREVLRHAEVQTVDLVEIDRRVVEVCREYLPGIAAGYDDPRVKMYFMDGAEYVRTTQVKYDVVILDSSDPIGPAGPLFGAPFYRSVREILNDDGMMVAQAESPNIYPDEFRAVYGNMTHTFPIAMAYLTAVPTYVGGFWAFAIGSLQADPAASGDDRPEINGLKYYTRELHKAAFVLPAFIQTMIRD